MISYNLRILFKIFVLFKKLKNAFNITQTKKEENILLAFGISQ
jgi:hypothetical protein